MASNFRITWYEESERLYIKLNGDFDGSSAYELLNTLNAHGHRFCNIHIDTDDLRTIYPFGREVFEKNFRAFKKKWKYIVFAGENGKQIAPDFVQT